MGIRLLGLDLDGTALDPGGKLPTAVIDAVQRVRARGVGVVICTGRRFRTALPIARELQLTGPMVVNNGVLIKEIESARTLHQAFLPEGVYAEALTLMRELTPPLIYVDDFHGGCDFLTERVEDAHVFQREYLAENGDFGRVVPDLANAQPDAVVMMSAMADTESLEALKGRVRQAFGERVHTHSLANKNYRGDILELLSPESGKWKALWHLACQRGIERAEIACVGDDSNAAEMIANAGLGIAMGNASPAARKAARLGVRSNAEGGGVEALEQVLIGV